MSSSAFAVGFLGGGLLLALNLAWIVKPEWFGLPDAVAGIHLSFLSVAIWWVRLLDSAVPARSRAATRAASGEERRPEPARGGASARVGETFRELRRYRNAFLMLLAFMIYNDGIQTIIRLATVYGAEIGIARDVADRRASCSCSSPAFRSRSCSASWPIASARCDRSTSRSPCTRSSACWPTR